MHQKYKEANFATINTIGGAGYKCNFMNCFPEAIQLKTKSVNKDYYKFTIEQVGIFISF